MPILRILFSSYFPLLIEWGEKKYDQLIDDNLYHDELSS